MNVSAVSAPAPNSAGLHLHAVLTACATLFLIFVGALVTSHDAGLAVPDWPTTYEENMFTYPPARWVGGIFWEHGHRLTATGIGLLTLVLALRMGLSETAKRRLRLVVRGIVAMLIASSLFRLEGQRLGMSLATNLTILGVFELFLRGAPESRRRVRRLAYLALFAVCLQGLLGGLTVHFMLPLPVSVAHGCLAQAFFCLTIVLAVLTSPSWIAFENQRRDGAPSVRGGPWRAFVWAAAVVYLQLAIGATMRHANAGLAFQVFPMPLEQFFPSTPNLGALVHVLHRRWAIVVAIFVLLAGWKLLRHPKACLTLKGLAALLMGLLVTQIGLGAWTIWSKLSPFPTSFHVVNGAAILGLCVLLGLRSYQRLSVTRIPK